MTSLLFFPPPSIPEHLQCTQECKHAQFSFRQRGPGNRRGRGLFGPRLVSPSASFDTEEIISGLHVLEDLLIHLVHSESTKRMRTDVT